jgi:predicted Zn-dependent protease with MMP-like domain
MRRRLYLSRGRIRRYVNRALESLPARFREAADNVIVVVENWPQAADYAARGGGAVKNPARDEPLLGVYRGIPLSDRAGYNIVTPDVIAVFRSPLLRMCRTRHEAEAEVRLTVLHEFGHFLGLSEEQVEHL